MNARLTLEALDLRLPPSSLLDPLADPVLAPPPATNSPDLVAASTATSPPPATTAPLPGATEPTQGTAPPPATADGGTSGSTLLPVEANIAPQIINFEGVEVVGGLWRFTGDVLDESPGGLTVYLGGEPVSLQGVTTKTAADGHFDVSVSLKTDGSDDGLAAAQTFDAAGAPSNVALYNIHPS